jgi:8-oxo-dGTP pyrophosphatase MutT (NUDIX family)
MQRHFTATAFVVDSKKRVLLLWHKRLERWMPPGGHVDANETPQDTARRECKEETGLDVEIVGEPQENLFAENPHEGQMLKKPIGLLLENIPESKERNEPAHQHMDFVYLARPLDESQTLSLLEEEGTQLRWFTQEEVKELNTKTAIFANVKHYVLGLLQDKIR